MSTINVRFSIIHRFWDIIRPISTLCPKPTFRTKTGFRTKMRFRTKTGFRDPGDLASTMRGIYRSELRTSTEVSDDGEVKFRGHMRSLLSSDLMCIWLFVVVSGKRWPAAVYPAALLPLHHYNQNHDFFLDQRFMAIFFTMSRFWSWWNKFLFGHEDPLGTPWGPPGDPLGTPWGPPGDPSGRVAVIKFMWPKYVISRHKYVNGVASPL